MIAEGIKKILEISRPEKIEVDNRPYITSEYTPVTDPTPNDIELNSLTGLVDYLKENPDSLDVSTLIVHVDDYNEVDLISPLTEKFQQRKEYIKSKAPASQFAFNRFMGVEDFIIGLNSQFIKDENTNRDYLLELVSSLSQESSETMKDNGMTQDVVVKNGVSMKGNATTKNPVILRPYRTFREIEQPASQFIFRIKKSDYGPQCGLYEADGGAWENECILSIRDYLKDQLAGLNVKILA